MSQQNSADSLYERALALQKQDNWEATTTEYLQIIAIPPN